MKKSKFNATQIVAILTLHENGQKVVDICRAHGISQPAFYQWRQVLRNGG